MEGDTITLQNLFEFQIEHVEADRTVVGQLEPTGLRPTFLPKFARHGIELPPDLFGSTVAAMFGAGANGMGHVPLARGDHA
jgi:pilus assembly protein CpaF